MILGIMGPQQILLVITVVIIIPIILIILLVKKNKKSDNSRIGAVKKIIRLNTLRKEVFKTVSISNDFNDSDYHLEEINIMYQSGIRLAISSREYVLLDSSNSVKERAFFGEISINDYKNLNIEIIRSMHDITQNIFNLKTDGKIGTITSLLNQQESAYTKKLLMQIQNLHEKMNYAGGSVSPYGIEIN